ncbi:hypothetical protein EXIGLDRAFT_769470 [Exidia glandulosa HHB12029]|uniref:Uncharacterized protein n=1 Tax=Exidia glandulosa HHB12029 TaxID=1314781 RepID=A0A165HH77_EXIGL|nr:hypothetical protein EXIGLDRAFT_769470 [Exidia glandulosa HHB12029]
MPHKRQRSRSSSKASFPSKKHKLDKQQKRLTKRSRYPKASSLRQAESAAFSDSHLEPCKSPYPNLCFMCGSEHNASVHWSDEWFSAESMDGASVQSSHHESMCAIEPSNNKPSNSGDGHEGSSHTDNEMDVDTTTKRWRRYSPSSIKTTNSSDVGTSHSNETGSHGKGNKTSTSGEEHRPDAWSYFDRAAGEGFHSSCAPNRCSHVCVVNNFRGPVGRVIVHTICRLRGHCDWEEEVVAAPGVVRGLIEG